MQDSRLKSQNFVEFDCRMFPLGLNTLDNPRENEIHLQLYQSYKKGRIYRCGEFDYIFQFQSWVCDYLCEFSPSLSYWFNWWAQAMYTLRTPRDRYLVDVYRVAVKLSSNSRNKIKRYRPGITHWNYVFSSRSKEADKAQSPSAETQLLWKFNTLRNGQSFFSLLGL